MLKKLIKYSFITCLLMTGVYAQEKVKKIVPVKMAMTQKKVEAISEQKQFFKSPEVLQPFGNQMDIAPTGNKKLTFKQMKMLKEMDVDFDVSSWLEKSRAPKGVKAKAIMNKQQSSPKNKKSNFMGPSNNEELIPKDRAIELSDYTMKKLKIKKGHIKENDGIMKKFFHGYLTKPSDKIKVKAKALMKKQQSSQRPKQSNFMGPSNNEELIPKDRAIELSDYTMKKLKIKKGHIKENDGIMKKLFHGYLTSE